jgi:hypothetical protein
MFDRKAYELSIVARRLRYRYGFYSVEYEDPKDGYAAGTEKYFNPFVARIDGTETDEKYTRDSWHNYDVACTYKSREYSARLDVDRICGVLYVKMTSKYSVC